MIEAEWLTCTDPQPMLEFVRGKASDRKLRLFAVACCRRIWHLIVEQVEKYHKDDAAHWQRCLDAVLLAELFADEHALTAELAAVTAYPRPALYDADAAMGCAEIPMNPSFVADAAAEAVGVTAARQAHATYFPNGYTPTTENIALMAKVDEEHDHLFAQAKASEMLAQCELLRCNVGNPFRLPTLGPTNGFTPEVVTLAQIIYDERAFDGLPILGERLEGAGCDNEDILAHCLAPGPHVRGCWVVDLLLGKE